MCFFAVQQNSSPAPAPETKPTMIDEWAVSVKPNADPTIIKKHIEKMVEVSFLWGLGLTPGVRQGPQRYGWLIIRSCPSQKDYLMLAGKLKMWNNVTFWYSCEAFNWSNFGLNEPQVKILRVDHHTYSKAWQQFSEALGLIYFLCHQKPRD